MKPLFLDPLTPDELYWCGMIHADGSINRPTLRVALGQKDRFVVEEFLRLLGQESKISKLDRVTTYGHGVAYVATSRVKHRDSVERLLALGVKGQILEALYASRHFWRGMVDGDGGVYRLGKHKMPFISLCSGKGPRDIEAYSSWVGSPPRLPQRLGPGWEGLSALPSRLSEVSLEVLDLIDCEVSRGEFLSSVRHDPDDRVLTVVFDLDLRVHLLSP